VIKYLDTEVSQRYEKLYEKGCPFEIEIASLQDAGEIINFRGYLQVVGVDKFNWATFQSRKATLEEIKQYFLDSLKPRLKTFATSTLAITDADEFVKIQDFVNNFANQVLVEQFGLIVNIRNWDRDRTESQVDQAVLEQKRNKVRIELETTKISKIQASIEASQNELVHKKILREIKQTADLSRYKKLQSEKEETEMLDEETINQELNHFEEMTTNLNDEDIETLLGSTSSEQQPKRLKFNQALQKQSILSSSDSSDSDSNDLSNSEEKN
ncbi:MAG: hypothetical protein ACKO7P_08605, partial [Bacteroidota bacterium]